MKSILRLTALALAVLTLASCGLPGAMVRSTGRAINGIDKLANSR